MSSTGATTSTFLKVIEKDLADVQSYLDTEISSAVQLVSETAHYNLSAGGKRLRPALVILSARISDWNGPSLVPAAAVVEMVHTATLVHDDLVDGASMRRGRMTTSKVWGDGVSVLTGDYLFTKAFHIISSQGDVVLPQILCDVAVKMCEAEMLQITRRGDVHTPEEDYFKIIYGKTASFIAGCCLIGARIAGASDEMTHALEQFGLHVGMAFQMVDDLLNFVGEESEVGKPVWNDLSEGKFSLPILAALQLSAPPVQKELKEILVNPENSSALPRILEIVQECRGVEYARENAQTHVDRAKGQLPHLPAGAYRDALEELADYVIRRDR